MLRAGRIVVLVVLLVGAATAWAVFELHRTGPPVTAPTIVTIEEGTRLSGVARELHARGLLRHPWLLVAYLMPERSLRNALTELTGHFLPVTEAAYWSDTLGESRTTASLLAVNHERAQILAPYRVADPWAGLDAPRPDSEPPPEASGW